MVRPAVTGESDKRVFGRGDAVAFVAALPAGLIVLGGLAPSGIVALLVAAFAMAVASAYVATGAGTAAFVAGVAGAMATLLAAAFGSAGVSAQTLGPISIVVVGVASAVFSAGLRVLDDRRMLRQDMGVVVAVTLLVGCVWLSTANLAPTQVVFEGKTMWQFLNERPQAGVRQVDQVFYNAVRLKVKDGTPYYEAFRDAYHENAIWATDPPNILSVREPLLSVVLAALPGDGRSVVWLMALLGSVAGVAAFRVPRDVAPAARIAAVAGVAAYFLYYTTMPFVFGHEAWGGALAVLTAAFAGAAFSAEDTRRETTLHITAAGIAVLAVAVRELMLFLPVAGILGATLLPKARRMKPLLIWTGSLVISGVVLLVHGGLASAIVTPARDAAAWLSMRGGVTNVVAGWTHGTRFLSGSGVILLLLAACGILGAVLQRNRSYRAFLVASILLPSILFLVSWNGASDEVTRRPVNYWGAIIAPLLFALVPGVLGMFDLSWRRLSERLETARETPVHDERDEW